MQTLSMCNSSRDIGCDHVVTDGACECARCVRCQAHVYDVVQHYKLRLERACRERDEARMYRHAGWMLFALFAGGWLASLISRGVLP